MAIKKVSGPTFKVTPDNNGDILELGPASSDRTGVLVIDFQPSMDWNGQFVVMGRILGEAARLKGETMKPVSYRLVNAGNVAGDYVLGSAFISDTATIQVPASALSIGLLVACAAGFMDVNVYRVQGSGAV
jgi:hypothetical protein